MDSLPYQNQPQATPDVPLGQKSFFQTKKGLGVLASLLGLIVFSLLLIGLNYYNVVSLSPLPFLPKRPPVNLSGTPVKITLIPENYGFRAGELTLNCPVESSFCSSRKLVNLGQKDAVSYQAASGSSVLTLEKVPDLENIAVLTNPKLGKKFFYESIISKDGKSCYTISYTLPSDASFANLLDLKSINESKIALLGKETFEVEGETSNVLIQVRNTPQDPGKPCSLLKKGPDFFKDF